jgi:DNA-binding LacI/PurR family transcriptional regulator
MGADGETGRMSIRKVGKKSAITSVDVARVVGVSQSVVSRAFNLDSSVAEATRERIFAVADELGYRRNLLARSLITRRSNLFALVTGALTSPLHLSLIEACTRITQQRGYRVLLFSTPPNETLDQALSSVLQYSPDGILALAGTPSENMVRGCKRDGIPIVLLGRDGDRSTAWSVSCDNEAEARRVAEALVQAEHRRFAFISSRDRTLSFSLDREKGFCETILARTGTAPIVENGDSTYQGGYEAGRRLLRRRNRPDAVFCASDPMALGLLDAARLECGLDVPGDLSVIGFDDVPMAAWASYELSTVRQRVDSMVEAATDILLNPLTSRISTAVPQHIPGDLIVRKSARLPANLL